MTQPGSTNALLYVDVSETADFAAYTAFGGSNVVGQLPAGRALVATGLDNGTAYYARIRAVNSWGLAGVSSTIPFETRLEPWAASPIGAAAVSGGTQLSMSIIELVEGDATLAIGTTEENALQVASWNGMATAPSAMTYIDGASTGTYVAQYIVTSTFGGEFYAETNTLTFTVGLNVYVAPTLADLVALRLKAGESVALPPLVAEQDFYRVLNARVATLGAGVIGGMVELRVTVRRIVAFLVQSRYGLGPLPAVHTALEHGHGGIPVRLLPLAGEEHLTAAAHYGFGLRRRSGRCEPHAVGAQRIAGQCRRLRRLRDVLGNSRLQLRLELDDGIGMFL